MTLWKGVLSGKKWYESLTSWGTILIAVFQGLEQAGAVIPGTTGQVNEVGTIVGALLVALGLRKAAGTK